MSMVEEALKKFQETKTRLLTTIDAFRPKLLIKKPLSEFKILGEGMALEAEGISTIIHRIQSRIQQIRGQMSFGGITAEESYGDSIIESQVREVTRKNKKIGILY